MENNFSVRYPIGKIEEESFSIKGNYDEDLKRLYIGEIERCPSLLSTAINGLTDEQLNSPYRDGGWTPKQIVHHMADSHLNGYVRFKLGLTEENPIIQTYEQNAWAVLPDTTLPVFVSLNLLEALHSRWVKMLQDMSQTEWLKTVFHPEQKREIRLWDLVSTYAWHGKHHTAQITNFRKRMGW